MTLEDTVGVLTLEKDMVIQSIQVTGGRAGSSRTEVVEEWENSLQLHPHPQVKYAVR